MVPPLDFEVLGDAAPAAPPPAALPAALPTPDAENPDPGFEVLGDVVDGKLKPKAKPWAITRGVAEGINQIGPRTLGNLVESLALGIKDPGHAKDVWDWAQDVKKWGDSLSGPEYKAQAKRLQDITGISDFGTLMGEMFGQGSVSIAPPLIGGAVGSAVGGAVGAPAGPAGVAAGAASGRLIGMAAPSYALNYSDIYESLKEEGLSPRSAKDLAKIVAVPIAGLDMLPTERILGNLTGNARNEAVKGIAKRLVNAAKEAAVTGGMEAGTEGAQQIIQEMAGALSTGKDPLEAQRWWSVLESVLGGGLVGAPMGAGSGLMARGEGKASSPPPTPGGGASRPPGAGQKPPEAQPAPPPPQSPPEAEPTPQQPPAAPVEGFEVLGDVPTSDDIAKATETIESGGNPNAKSATSSAAGPHGFIDGTWLDLMSRYRPDLTKGKSRSEILAMRADRDISTEMSKHYADENARVLSNAGIEPNPQNTYLAHFLGAGGARKVLLARPGTPVNQLLKPDAIASNPGLLTDAQGNPRTAGFVVRTAAGKMRAALASHGIAMPGETPDAAAKAMVEDAPNLRETEGAGPDPIWFAMASGLIPPSPEFNADGLYAPKAAKASAEPEATAPAAEARPTAQEDKPSAVPGRVPSGDAKPGPGVSQPTVGERPTAEPSGSEVPGGAGPVAEPDLGGSAGQQRLPDRAEPDAGSGRPDQKPAIRLPDLTETEQAAPDAGQASEAATPVAASPPPAGTAPAQPAVAPVKPLPTLVPPKPETTNDDIERMFDDAVGEAFPGQEEKPAAAVEPQAAAPVAKQAAPATKPLSEATDDDFAKLLAEAADEEFGAAPAATKEEPAKPQEPEPAPSPTVTGADEATPTPAAPAVPPVAAELAKLGITITEGETPKGAKMWEVRGIGKERAEALRDKGAGLSTAGLRWYGPKKVWSAPQSKGPIAEKLLAHLKRNGVVEAVAATPAVPAVRPATTTRENPSKSTLSEIKRHIRMNGGKTTVSEYAAFIGGDFDLAERLLKRMTASGVLGKSGGENNGREEYSIKDGAPGTLPAPTAQSEEKWRKIGVNRDGNPVFEDDRGVRSYTEGGIRSSEAVGLKPTREGGYDVSVDKARRSSEYKTAEELAAETTATEPTAADVAKSAAANLGSAAVNAIDGLGKLFGVGDPTRLGMNLSFDEDTYAKAKPLFITAAADLQAFTNDVTTLVKMLVKEIKARLNPTREEFDRMTPYLTQFLKDLQSGAVELPKEAAAVTSPTQDQVNAWLPKATSAAIGFTNNEVSGEQLLARTANAMGVTSYKRGTEEGKVVEEVAEAALVGAYKAYANRSLRAKKSEREVFDGLVRRYNVQPTLGTRTSTSAANQAYSTPAPLAYMVGRLVSPGDTILEPTAGTGMLLIGAPGVNGTVNEIDPLRAKLLRAAGEAPTTVDATSEALAKGPFDAVLMNPPFGRVSDAAGNATWMAVKNDAGDVIFRSKSIDQVIAANAAQRIKPGGMVALIMAGPSPQTIEAGEKARTDHYAASNAAFHLWMHRNFDVGAHFTTLGALYRKQGAAWPIDVIIGVRRTGEIARDDVASIQGNLPANTPPAMVDSWNGVYDALVRAGEWKRSYVRPTSEVAAGSEQPVGQEGVSGEPAGGVAEGGVGGQGATRPANRPVAGGQGGAVRGGGGGRGSPVQGTEQPDAGGVPVGERDGGAVSEGDRGRDGQPDVGGTDGLGGSVRGERPAVEAADEQAANDLDPLNENELQSTYVPSSAGTRMDTLTPKALAVPAQYALRELKSRVGDIHEYVRKELQYTDKAFYDKAISSEMRDALGLAIDNLKRETGFVIGDQTGVGKGRFVAGILRWARLNGHIPVFMTEKPGLYSAMLRDLWDVGERDFKAFPTNKDLKGEKAILAEDPENKMVVAAPADHGKILDSRALPAGYHGVFTTYDQMNTRKGQLDRRHQFLAGIAPKAIFVLDESHNAVGQGITDAEYQQMIGSGKEWLPREILIRDQLLRRAKGAVFSSATFAKRPTAMMLYEIKTDIGLAAPGVAVSTLLGQGGVPMQQAMSALLVKSGQMARREKSFEGVEFHEPVLELDVRNVDNFSDGISDIADFDAIAKGYIKNVSDGGRGAWGSSSASVESAVASTEFASVMHNIVDQASAAMKADAVADMVLAELDAGRKPVVAFDNTMGSLLAEMVAKGDAAVGQPIDFGLHTLLQRYLARTLRYTVKPVGDPNAKSVERWFPVEQMSPEHQAQYHALMNRFQRQFGDAKIPGSPIDWVAYRLGERGIKIGEITGRDYRVDYKTGTLQRRDSADRTQAGKLKVITKFNGGSKSRPTPAGQRIDAIILNRSGSTGISLHAGELFGDQRQRVMVLAQFEKNIDTFIQLLGRVNRTGQVSKPIYYIPSSNVPAENRLLAVLKKKLISLQANVTASGKGQIDIKKVPDFINEIGGTVINEMVSRSRAWQQRLRVDPLGQNPAAQEVESFARRVTGRVSLLHITQQQNFYSQLLEGFDEEVKLRRGMGQQIGAAELLPMDAKPVARQMYWPKDGPRVAQGAVHAVEVDAKLLDPIPTWDSAFAATQRVLNGEDGSRHMRAMLKNADLEYDKAHAEMQEELDRLEAARNKMADSDGRAAGISERIAALTSELTKHEETWNEIQEFLKRHYIGSGISMTFGDNPSGNGVVTNVYRVPGTVDPASFSAWRMEIIFAGRRPSYIKQTLNRLPRSTAERKSIDDVHEDFRALAEKYASGRERRIALMGNTVRAFARSKNGQIVQLTDAKGRISEAVLLPFEIESLAEAEQDSLRFLDSKTAADYLAKTKIGGAHLRGTSPDHPPVKLSRRGDDIEIWIATRNGRRYYANPSVIMTLEGRQLVKSPYTNGYEGRIPAESPQARSVIAALMSAAPEGKNALHPVRDLDTAREVHGLPKGQSTIEMDKSRGLFEQMDELLLEGEGDALPTEPEGKASRFTTAAEPQIDPAVRERIVKRIKAIAKQIAPSANVEVFDQIPGAADVGGFYDPATNMIEVALKIGDPDVAVRHETIHHLRTAGLFTDAEWKALTRHAEQAGMLARVNDIEGYADLTDEGKLEEAVAQQFAENMAGTPLKAPIGPLRSAFHKAMTFFRRLAAAIRGMGFKTIEDIHQDIETGRVGARQTYPASGEKALDAAAAQSTATGRAVYVMQGEEGGLRLDLDAKRNPGESLIATVFGDEVQLAHDQIFDEYMRNGVSEADLWKYGVERLRALARQHEASMQPKYSRFKMDEQSERIAEKTFGTTDRSLKERLMDWGREYLGNSGRKLIQQVADRYRTWNDYERDVNGTLLDASRSAYKQLRMAGRATPDAAYHIVYRGPLEVQRDGNGGIFWGGKKGWKDGGIRDIVEPLAKRGLLKMWELQRVITRAARLDSEGREKLLRAVADGENMTVPELSRLINGKIAAMSDEHRAMMREADRKWERFNAAMLDFAEDAGLISKEDRALYENSDYIPFYRLYENADDIEALMPHAGGANSRHVRSGIKRLKGGEAKINAIVENMISNATSLASRGIANIAKGQALRAAESWGAAKHLTTVDMMRSRNVKLPTVVAALRKFGWEVDLVPENFRNHVVEMWLKEFPDAADVVSVMRDGKPEYYRLADPDLMAGLVSVRIEQLNDIVRMLQPLKRLLTRGVTAMPPFMYRNFVRDTMATWMMTGLAPGLKTIRAMIGTARRDETYWTIMGMGGTGGGFYSSEAGDMRRRLDNVNTGNDIGSRVLKVVSTPWEYLTRLGEISELTNRRAVYDWVKANGGTDAEAAYHAVDLLDFGLTGASHTVRSFRSMVAFLGARINGLYRMYRAFEDPTSSPLSKGVQQRMVAGMVMGVLLRGLAVAALSVALEGLMGDDDDYQDMPDWKKDAYWVLPGGYLFPKPFEFGFLFATIPQRLYRLAAGEDKPSDFGESMISGLLNTLAFNPVATGLVPIVEQLAGKKFFPWGSPVVPRSIADLRPEYQYMPYTGETARQIGALAGISPVRFEGLIRGYTGDLGMYALAATDGLLRAALDNPVPPAAPVEFGETYGVLEPLEKAVNGIWASMHERQPARSTKTMEEFYALRSEIQSLSSSVKAMKKAGNFDEGRDLQDRYREELALESQLNSASDRLSSIRRRENKVWESRDSAVTKREKLDNLQQERNDLAKDFMRRPAVLRVIEGIQAAQE